MKGLARLPTLMVFVVLASAGMPTFAAAPVPRADELRAIFTREAARKAWSWLLRPQQEFWTPTLADVRELEARLPAYLLSPEARKVAEGCCPQPVPLATRAPSYRRQYVGVLDHGRRSIHASFFCEEPRSDWHVTPVDVDDGGDCYFQVDYDVGKRRFTSISVNGGA